MADATGTCDAEPLLAKDSGWSTWSDEKSGVVKIFLTLAANSAPNVRLFLRAGLADTLSLPNEPLPDSSPKEGGFEVLDEICGLDEWPSGAFHPVRGS